MAQTLLFADGMGEDYTSVGTYWAGSHAAGEGFITGRFGVGTALKCANDPRFGVQQDILPSVITGGATVMCAAYLTALPAGKANIVTLSTPATVYLIALGVNSSGQIVVYRGSVGAGTLIATSSASVIQAAAWYHYEMEFTIHASTGRVKVWINGDPTAVIDFTGNTAGTTSFSTIHLMSNSDNDGGGSLRVDDLLVYDNGGTMQGQIGDQKVEVLFPSGNGSSSQLTGSDGNSTDNYLLVDDVNPDTTDYVGSATSGNKDLYEFTDLSVTTGVIKGIMVNAWVARTEAGFKQMKPVLRQSGTDYDGTAKTLPSSFTRFFWPYDSNPATSAAFTISEINAMEFGMKVV